jgi:hypothetical protein
LLAGLYDEAQPPLDTEFARALGVRTTLAALLAEPGGANELLTRLADPARSVTRGQLRALWIALSAVADVEPPDRVRAVRRTDIVVADAAEALVLDAPDLWPLVADHPLVLAPYYLAPKLADLLYLPLASEEVTGQVESTPQRAAVPAIVRAVLPDAPAEYYAHDRLIVDGIAVPWRSIAGAVHADGIGGLACGLAWTWGRWSDRHLLDALLRDPAVGSRLLAEADLDADAPDIAAGPG